MYLKTECEMAVQGHPRYLLSVPIENAYATSYLSSIVASSLCSTLPCFGDVAGFLLRTATPPYSTRILGVFPSG